MMKLTILTQYYPPETGAPQNRLHDLARRFHSFGHHVEVLTALPNYPGNRIYSGYEKRSGMREIIDGVEVCRVGLFVPHRKTLLGQLLAYTTFSFNAWRRGARLLHSSDAVLMESPPIFLSPAAVHLAHRLGALLIINVSDLWPQAVVDLGKIRPGPALWAARKLEAWMYRKADAIFGQTEAIVADIHSRFSKKEVFLFPNGVDTGRYDVIDTRVDTREQFGWDDGTFVVGYTGVFGHSQALDQVVTAALHLEKKGVSDILFALFGDGAVRSRLEERIHRENVENIKIYPHQPADRMPSIQAAFDAGLVPLAKGKVFEGARPSKMFEYMAAGIPLVLCARGEAVQVMNGPGGNCGVAVDPESPEKLAQALLHLSRNREEARRMGKRGKENVRLYFDREAIAKKIETNVMRMIYNKPEGRNNES